METVIIDLAKIKELRLKKRFSLEDMATYLGYESPNGYLYLESGRCSMGAIKLYLITKKLGIQSMESLFLCPIPTKTVAK